jgi:hypothetical protein
MTQDLHRDTAARLFGVRPEDVTEEQRKVGKTANFLDLYNPTINNLPKANPLVKRLFDKGLSPTGRVTNFHEQAEAGNRAMGQWSSFFSVYGGQRYGDAAMMPLEMGVDFAAVERRMIAANPELAQYINPRTFDMDAYLSSRSFYRRYVPPFSLKRSVVQ